MKANKIFKSFLMGGYECADQINRSGDRINLLSVTEHDKRVDEDYELLKVTKIKTVREGICWSQVESKPGIYDFSEVAIRMQAAKEHGIEVIWDMCHFGYPDDLSPTHPRFSERFAALCKAFVKFYRSMTDAALYIVPINEISFLAWHSGDMRGTVPFAVDSGWDIKYHLCKAAIKGIQAIKDTDDNCRIVLVEPLINIKPKPGEDFADHHKMMNDHQYQAMDIIGGRICPELGGSEDFLDILGFNYYYNNQWEHDGTVLHWPEHVDLHTPLSELLVNAYKRYSKPMLLSETGHFGGGRAEWFEYVTRECKDAIIRGVDLQGVCLYPVISRPDWDDLGWYHDSGIWDISTESKVRKSHLPLIQAIEKFNGATYSTLNKASGIGIMV